MRERPLPPQRAAATGKRKVLKLSQRKSPICALSVETASQKLQLSSSTGAVTQVSPCEVGSETRVLSLLRNRGERRPTPSDHRKVEGQEPWEEIVHLHQQREAYEIVGGNHLQAVEKNCWVRSPINM